MKAQYICYTRFTFGVTVLASIATIMLLSFMQGHIPAPKHQSRLYVASFRYNFDAFPPTEARATYNGVCGAKMYIFTCATAGDLIKSGNFNGSIELINAANTFWEKSLNPTKNLVYVVLSFYLLALIILLRHYKYINNMFQQTTHTFARERSRVMAIIQLVVALLIWFLLLLTTIYYDGSIDTQIDLLDQYWVGGVVQRGYMSKNIFVACEWLLASVTGLHIVALVLVLMERILWIESAAPAGEEGIELETL